VDVHVVAKDEVAVAGQIDVVGAGVDQATGRRTRDHRRDHQPRTRRAIERRDRDWGQAAAAPSDRESMSPLGRADLEVGSRQATRTSALHGYTADRRQPAQPVEVPIQAFYVTYDAMSFYD
jgi:hypothetical protein